jgi:hypothetical protein
MKIKTLIDLIDDWSKWIRMPAVIFTLFLLSLCLPPEAKIFIASLPIWEAALLITFILLLSLFIVYLFDNGSIFALFCRYKKEVNKT